MPNANPNDSAKKPAAYFGDTHPAGAIQCPTCNASPSAPCVSTVPAFGHGATGAPIRGLHAARIQRAADFATVADCAPVAERMAVAS